ncbi:hypothetical protein SADUNF_Sadunf14G0037400 [Salix dunnii]|uniref:Ankyrin repeat family protein n=1 Tax=Salix dunnii TaxID=1413687 RepID=A0A835MLY0_9ROSI|nr:hypothetical protein SADUNF_Sadunf14G0037400 [Salix dunnii]
MATYSEAKEVYLATLKEDLKSLTEFYEKHDHRLLFPEFQVSESEVEEADITLMKNKPGETPLFTAAAFASKDIALHMAVYGEDEKLLRDILLDSAQYFPTPVDHEHPMHMKNIHGDAYSCGSQRWKHGAVKLLNCSAAVKSGQITWRIQRPRRKNLSLFIGRDDFCFQEWMLHEKLYPIWDWGGRKWKLWVAFLGLNIESYTRPIHASKKQQLVTFSELGY